jgi:hypothetical protein
LVRQEDQMAKDEAPGCPIRVVLRSLVRQEEQMEPHAARRLGLALAGAALIVAACGDPGPPTSPSNGPSADGPLLIRGMVVDAARSPVSGAMIQLHVWDSANAKVGEPVPIVFHAETTTAANGDFEFNLTPSRELAEFASDNNNFVNFGIDAIAGSAFMGTWNFPRQIVGEEWFG